MVLLNFRNLELTRISPLESYDVCEADRTDYIMILYLPYNPIWMLYIFPETLQLLWRNQSAP